MKTTSSPTPDAVTDAHLLDARALLEGFAVCATVPISWGLMDAFGHVNNIQYFRFFEDARIAYFQAAGIDMQSASRGHVGPILASTSCRFRAPVTFPDTLLVGARVTGLGEDRFRLEHHAVSAREQRLVATGDALVVSFDYTTQRKAPLPASWRQRILGMDPEPATIVRPSPSTS